MLGDQNYTKNRAKIPFKPFSLASSLPLNNLDEKIDINGYNSSPNGLPTFDFSSLKLVPNSYLSEEVVFKNFFQFQRLQVNNNTVNCSDVLRLCSRRQRIADIWKNVKLFSYFFKQKKTAFLDMEKCQITSPRSSLDSADILEKPAQESLHSLRTELYTFFNILCSLFLHQESDPIKSAFLRDQENMNSLLSGLKSVLAWCSPSLPVKHCHRILHQTFYLDLDVRWKVLEVLHIWCFWNESDIQSSNNRPVKSIDTKQILVDFYLLQIHLFLKDLLIISSLYLPLVIIKRSSFPSSSSATKAERPVLELWCLFMIISRHEKILPNFWKSVHSALKLVISGNEFPSSSPTTIQFIEQIWDLSITLFSVQQSLDKKMPCALNEQKEEEINDFWEIIKSLTSLTVTYVDDNKGARCTSVIHRLILRLWMISKSLPISNFDILKKLWIYFKLYKYQSENSSQLAENVFVLMPSNNESLQSISLFVQFLQLVTLHIKKVDDDKLLNRLVSHFSAHLPFRVIISDAVDKNSSKQTKPVTALGLSNMISLLCFIAKFSSETVVQKLDFGKRIVKLMDFSKSGCTGRKVVIKGLFQLLSIFNGKKFALSVQKEVLKEIFGVGKIVVSEIGQLGNMSQDLILFIFSHVNEALDNYPFETFVDLFLNSFCETFSAIFLPQSKFSEDVLISFSNSIMSVLKAYAFFLQSNNTSEEEGPDSYDVEFDDAFFFEEQNKEVRAEKENKIDVRELVPNILYHTLYQSISKMVTHLSDEFKDIRVMKPIIKCCAKIQACVINGNKKRALSKLSENEYTSLVNEVESSVSVRKWIESSYKFNGRQVILYALCSFVEEGCILNHDQIVTIWFLSCLDFPLGVQNELFFSIYECDKKFKEYFGDLPVESFKNKEEFSNNKTPILRSFLSGVQRGFSKERLQNGTNWDQCRKLFPYFDGVMMVQSPWSIKQPQIGDLAKISSQEYEAHIRFLEKINSMLVQYCAPLLYKKNNNDCILPKLFLQLKPENTDIHSTGRILSGLSTLDYVTDPYIINRVVTFFSTICEAPHQEANKGLKFLFNKNAKDKDLIAFRTYLVTHVIRHRFLSLSVQIISQTINTLFFILMMPLRSDCDFSTCSNEEVKQMKFNLELEIQTNVLTTMSLLLMAFDGIPISNEFNWAMYDKMFRFLSTIIGKITQHLSNQEKSPKDEEQRIGLDNFKQKLQWFYKIFFLEGAKGITKILSLPYLHTNSSDERRRLRDESNEPGTFSRFSQNIQGIKYHSSESSKKLISSLDLVDKIAKAMTLVLPYIQLDPETYKKMESQFLVSPKNCLKDLVAGIQNALHKK